MDAGGEGREESTEQHLIERNDRGEDLFFATGASKDLSGHRSPTETEQHAQVKQQKRQRASRAQRVRKKQPSFRTGSPGRRAASSGIPLSSSDDDTSSACTAARPTPRAPRPATSKGTKVVPHHPRCKACARTNARAHEVLVTAVVQVKPCQTSTGLGRTAAVPQR